MQNAFNPDLDIENTTDKKITILMKVAVHSMLLLWIS
jgi:hypothetical protein